jgi:hypothetical protein
VLFWLFFIHYEIITQPFIVNHISIQRNRTLYYCYLYSHSYDKVVDKGCQLVGVNVLSNKSVVKFFEFLLHKSQK